MIELSLACQVTDRTRALLDGKVVIEGCKINFMSGPAEEIFQRAFRHAEFDISELSLGTHLLTTARDESGYIGVPVFLSRSFRHSAIYVRTDRGIDFPQALKGCRVGVPDFQQTAGIWVRGMLGDEYGVDTRDVSWVVGGLEQAGREARVPYSLPGDIRIEPIGAEQTLSRMLDAGDIDAVIAPKPPSCFGRNERVRRLFPDFRSDEEAWFGKTGLFPPMHMLGIRRTLVEQHPWLPVNVYAAFRKSRDLALAELAVTDTLRVMHPWITSEFERVKSVMGDDYWRYGVKENRADLDTLQRYARSDGLIQEAVPMERLFATSTFDRFNF
ncbi:MULTISPECIES: ABC transporter substrate-binding protein [Paraburkholderia]|uniref:ABC transporter substrate-binding protein n=1 Tax=Paraburkholderia TaxID=1822464 RepID=UPI00225856BB|nr:MULTISPECIES: ABC transporter substrate-binding protein [Paraburkholderia]MCX4157586.1 ABC transporter substrate-binding protein [Paraburkholderia aspalathi]MDN7166990.1 ABC transporter substrate-binding protein [Paraburkholderia sp. SECH2]MDQ6395476.1 ABC transporter substrate-binding protein [Paraburkholderia aspalathi]